MLAFLVGLFVILMIGVVSVLGVLLFPLLIVLGFFLRFVVMILLGLFVIWVIGKTTLVVIQQLRKPKQTSLNQNEIK